MRFAPSKYRMPFQGWIGSKPDPVFTNAEFGEMDRFAWLVSWVMYYRIYKPRLRPLRHPRNAQLSIKTSSLNSNNEIGPAIGLMNMTFADKCA